jgi:hypothetical protein
MLFSKMVHLYQIAGSLKILFLKFSLFFYLNVYFDLYAVNPLIYIFILCVYTLVLNQLLYKPLKLDSYYLNNTVLLIVWSFLFPFYYRDLILNI